MTVSGDELVDLLAKLPRYRVNVRVEFQPHHDRTNDHAYYLTEDYVRVKDLQDLLDKVNP